MQSRLVGPVQERGAHELAGGSKGSSAPVCLLLAHVLAACTPINATRVLGVSFVGQAAWCGRGHLSWLPLSCSRLRGLVGSTVTLIFARAAYPNVLT